MANKAKNENGYGSDFGVKLAAGVGSRSAVQRVQYIELWLLRQLDVQLQAKNFFGGVVAFITRLRAMF